MTEGRPFDAPARDRKAEHIQLALDPMIQLGRSAFDDFTFEHVALPEIDLATIDTSVEFLGRRLKAPLLISCMTGGTESARRINENLARGAEEVGIALGIGSQRKALEDRAQAQTFEVRHLCPSVPLLANLGAVQLNYGYGIAECRAAVAMVGADALVLHLNPLQEALQPEGQGDFGDLLPKIGSIAQGLEVPVAAKEIGCGISGAVARRLFEHGVEIIDVAGTGGTSWARIEGHRASTPDLGELFSGWGVSTPECLEQVRSLPGLTVIGSGGLRTGVDVAKAIALGAHLAGLAFPFLEAATVSAARVVETAARIIRELRICMFCTGARTIADLKRIPLHKKVAR